MVEITFPADIANVRYSVQQANEDLRKENPVPSPVLERTLPLANIVESDSELPNGWQSQLTAASVERVLADMINRLRQDEPRVVAVAATDVRDRAFLFDQVRNYFPSTMLVNFETDHLLAHPEFAHASLGALTSA